MGYEQVLEILSWGSWKFLGFLSVKGGNPEHEKLNVIVVVVVVVLGLSIQSCRSAEA